MKFGRRAFLQFAAGAVGGTLLSPLPWRLMDEAAIWSQNWSWRPSPERGPVTKKPTACTLCDGGCGIQVHLVNGNRAILVEGNPDNPVNRGGICPLGAAGLQFLYAPYRVAQPLRQTRKRGDPGGFQPISWADATGELVKRLGQIRTDGKPNTVAAITRKRRSSMDDLFRQFFMAYGSPNLFKMPSQADGQQAAAALTLGQDGPFAFSLEKASYVLSFGADLIEGWGAPGRMQAVFGQWREGGKSSAKIVQVESRCSLTASKADRWVAVAPGTEAALALAIAHVFVKEKLYDAGFVTDNLFGFDDWTDAQGKSQKGFKTLILTDAYTPEAVSKSTGVDAAKIRELAKEFASQKNALAVWGGSIGDLPCSLYGELSFLALNALKGNFKSGGMVSLAPPVPLAALPNNPVDPLAQQGLAQQRLDLAEAGKDGLPAAPGNNLHAFLDAVARGGKYPIDVLLVHEANPAYELVETKVFQDALAKIGFLASFSSYMDETALQADMILPNHNAFEACDDVIDIPGVPYAYYAVSSPVLKPLLNTKATGDVILEVAKGIGGSVASALPWASYEEVLKNRVNGLAASSKGAVGDKKSSELWKLQAGDAVSGNYKDGADLWKKLTAGAFWYDAPIDPLKGLKTPSGRYELAARPDQGKGASFLPQFPRPLAGDEKEYPLLLVTYRMLTLANENLPNPPFMTKTLFDFVLKHNEQFANVNPATAASMGILEAEPVVLKTPQGELSVRIHLSSSARPGVVYIAQGLGHNAYDEYIRDKGVNANSVIEVQLDPVTGLGTAWATRAQLRRA